MHWKTQPNHVLINLHPPPCSPSPGVNVIVSHHENQVGGELGEYLRPEVYVTFQWK